MPPPPPRVNNKSLAPEPKRPSNRVDSVVDKPKRPSSRVETDVDKPARVAIAESSEHEPTTVMSDNVAVKNGAKNEDDYVHD